MMPAPQEFFFLSELSNSRACTMAEFNVEYGLILGKEMDRMRTISEMFPGDLNVKGRLEEIGIKIPDDFRSKQ